MSFAKCSIRYGVEVCTVMGTVGIPWGNCGNGDHIHGNTVGTGSRLTGLPWGWEAMLTVIPGKIEGR